MNDEETRKRNLAQIKEAMSAENRYFFWQKYGRDGDESELMLYYIESGGALGFALRTSYFKEDTTK